MAMRTRLIDSVPPADRQKPMGVLALGLSRTGTFCMIRLDGAYMDRNNVYILHISRE
jgi:hypothetical protein